MDVTPPVPARRSATPPRRAVGQALAAALLVVAGLAPAAPLGAQAAPAVRWYGAGVGVRSVRFTCDACASDRDGGPAMRLEAGRVLRPGLGVALTGGAWSRSAGDVRETLWQAGVRARLHPRPEAPLHLIGGLGWNGWRAGSFRYDAVGVAVGVGWAVPVGDRWSVSVGALLDASSFGRLRNDQTPAAGDVSLSAAGLELTVLRR